MNRLISAPAYGWLLLSTLVSGPALAQQGPPPPYGGAPPPYPQQQPYPSQPYPPPQPYPAPQPGYGQPYPSQPYPPPQPYPAPQPAPRPAPSKESSLFEISSLYGTSIGYGAGLGIWIDSELGLTDPGILLIAPSVLGIAAPIGVYVLDHPAMPRGMPAAISTGLLLGAGEGLGIAGTQFVIASEADAWGFRGLGRSVAIGATVGGVGGYLVGEYAEPSPKLSGFVLSGAVWGTLVGASFGYGVSPAGVGYGQSNDYGAVGGLVGFNVGMLATAGLSMVFVPSWNQIQGMWEGAGIGALASLPVFLFYAGDSGPPAKRGLVFSGTAMLLGIGAGAVFSSGGADNDASRSAPDDGDSAEGFATITSIMPFQVPGGAGVSVGGILY